MDNNVEISPNNRDIRLITSLEKALGHRPAPDDEIVVLQHGSGAAAERLRDAQKYGAPGG
jgi:hypothetical protein